MANPAQLLHTLLITWRGGQQQSAEAARGAACQGNWDAHRIAVSHLNAIENLLGQLEASGRNIRVYRQQFPTWCQAVFAYPLGCKGQGSAAIAMTS